MKFLSLPTVLVAVLLMVAAPVFAQSATLVATVRPNPLEVEISAPGSVPVGKWFEIKATISNQGSVAVTKTSAKIHKSSTLSIRGKKKRIGNLDPGSPQTITWQAKANQTGKFVILVEVEGVLEGEKISASNATVILATGSILLFWLGVLFGG